MLASGTALGGLTSYCRRRVSWRKNSPLDLNSSAWEALDNVLYQYHPMTACLAFSVAQGLSPTSFQACFHPHSEHSPLPPSPSSLLALPTRIRQQNVMVGIRRDHGAQEPQVPALADPSWHFHPCHLQKRNTRRAITKRAKKTTKAETVWAMYRE